MIYVSDHAVGLVILFPAIVEDHICKNVIWERAIVEGRSIQLHLGCIKLSEPLIIATEYVSFHLEFALHSFNLIQN